MRAVALVCCVCAVTARGYALGSDAPRTGMSASAAARKPLDPSIDELEGIVRWLHDKAANASSAMRHMFKANRRLVLTAGGAFGLAHGSSVAFTVLFLQSFGVSGWPLVRSAARRGLGAYEAAKNLHARPEAAGDPERVTPLRRELLALAAQLAELRREGADAAAQQAIIRQMRSVRRKIDSVPPRQRAAPVLIAACEPAVVRDVALGIWTGLTVSLAAACSSAVRTIGVGITLGEAVSKAATALQAKLEPALRRATSALPAEAVMLTYLGPSIVGKATLSLFGRSVGCWLAWRLQNLAAVLSVSLISARTVMDAIAPPVQPLAHESTKAADASNAGHDEHDCSSSDEDGAHSSGGSDGHGNGDQTRSHRQSANRRTSRAVVPHLGTRRPPWHVSEIPQREAIAWLAAVVSLQSQRARSFKLPLYLKAPLLPGARQHVCRSLAPATCAH
jgi:hypothetical protein